MTSRLLASARHWFAEALAKLTSVRKLEAASKALRAAADQLICYSGLRINQQSRMSLKFHRVAK